MAIKVGRSFKATQVKQVLRSVGSERGFPQFMRSDNGSEFIAGIIKEFLAENNVKAAYIEPNSPGKTAKATRFNVKFPDDCLRMEIFGNWCEAEVIAERRRQFYNTERLHSSLSYQTPNEIQTGLGKATEITETGIKEETRQPNGLRFGVLTAECPPKRKAALPSDCP